jgi:hypothetical protein
MKTKFKGYNPQLKPLGLHKGGGFTVSFEVPETEWVNIKDLNNPTNQQKEFTITLKGKIIK